MTSRNHQNQDEPLREARAVYVRAKKALTSGLRAVVGSVRLDHRTGYVRSVKHNLLPGVSVPEIKAEFEGGGHELKSKMRAPWSSSALAVNCFAPWRKDQTRLELAGRSGFAGRIRFEAACPNGVARFVDPHLDVLLEKPSEIVAVESKCTEFIQGGRHKPVSASYTKLAQRGDARASSRWFAALEEVGRFRLLDAYQLVKHYLGLRHTFPDRELTLVYLFWEPANARSGNGVKVFDRHRREVDEFSKFVNDDGTCRFVSLSYPEYWVQLAQLERPPHWLREHLRILRLRYEVVV